MVLINAEDWLGDERERELVAFEPGLFRRLDVERRILAIALAALRWRASITAAIWRRDLEPQPGRNVPAFLLAYVEHQVDALLARLQCPPAQPGPP